MNNIRLATILCRYLSQKIQRLKSAILGPEPFRWELLGGDVETSHQALGTLLGNFKCPDSAATRHIWYLRFLRL